MCTEDEVLAAIDTLLDEVFLKTWPEDGDQDLAAEFIRSLKEIVTCPQ